jgi:hypothetical protein
VEVNKAALAVPCAAPTRTDVTLQTAATLYCLRLASVNPRVKFFADRVQRSTFAPVEVRPFLFGLWNFTQAKCILCCRMTTAQNEKNEKKKTPQNKQHLDQLLRHLLTRIVLLVPFAALTRTVATLHPTAEPFWQLL